MHFNYFLIFSLFLSSFAPALSMEQAAPATNVSSTTLAASITPYAIGAGSIGAGAILARTIDKNRKPLLKGLENTAIFLFRTTPSYIQKNFPRFSNKCQKSYTAVCDFLEPYNTGKNKAAAFLTLYSGLSLFYTALGVQIMAECKQKQLPCSTGDMVATAINGAIAGSIMYVQSQLWEGNQYKV